jgi:hypothetical protein
MEHCHLPHRPYRSILDDGYDRLAQSDDELQLLFVLGSTVETNNCITKSPFDPIISRVRPAIVLVQFQQKGKRFSVNCVCLVFFMNFLPCPF